MYVAATNIEGNAGEQADGYFSTIPVRGPLAQLVEQLTLNQ